MGHVLVYTVTSHHILRVKTYLKRRHNFKLHFHNFIICYNNLYKTLTKRKKTKSIIGLLRVRVRQLMVMVRVEVSLQEINQS